MPISIIRQIIINRIKCFSDLDRHRDALAAGDSVSCMLSDGTTVSGSVETVSGGIATVLISDDGPKYDDEVTVLDKEGNELNKGNAHGGRR